MPIARNRPVRPASERPPATVPPARGTERARAFVLDVPFLHRGVANDAGARWDKDSQAYLYRGAALPSVLDPYRSQPYSWERLCEDELNGVAPAPRPPTREITLRPHQIEAVEAFRKAMAAGRTTFLNADDVGLGKTIEAWQSVLEVLTEVELVLIVTPLNAIAHWRRTIGWMGDGGKRIVIINYDRLRRLFETPEVMMAKMRGRRRKVARRVRTQKGVAKFGQAYEFDALIWDESQKLRNLESARSKLSVKLNAEGDVLMWLSATAGQDPLELAYLAPLLSEATGTRMSELADYEKWCQAQGIGVSRGKFGKWSWRGRSPDPAEREAADADLDLMNRILFGGPVPQGIRRSPTDIEGWPEINRILMPVPLDAEDRVNYDRVWQEFRRELALERDGRADSANALVARLRFRQKSSLLRTSATLDLAENLLEQGMRVAISTAFTETWQILQEALEKAGYGVATINGTMGGPQKEAQRLDFQYGRKDVCLYTVEEAISLHEGEFIEVGDSKRANIIHDLRWSAISMKQIEGRTHRDGKSSPVWWMLGENTIEEDIAEVVATRLRAMSRMHGDASTAADVEKLLERLAA